MYKFSRKSLEKLKTCEEKLSRVVHRCMFYQEMDFTVLEGHRSVERQQELYHQGASKLDGLTKKSKHNYSPSRAVDIAPYPIDWKDHARFDKLAALMKRAAKEEGVDLVWGGDWKSFIDKPHYELLG